MSETSLKNSIDNLDYESELTQKLKKMFPTIQKTHVSPFGSNSINSFNAFNAFVKNIRWDHVEYLIQFPRVEYSDEFFETMVTNV
jgi:hypothetical protein